MDDGWIEWAGGDVAPVADEVRVDVRFRSGSIDHGDMACTWDWSHDFDQDNKDAEIIAYRLSEAR